MRGTKKRMMYKKRRDTKMRKRRTTKKMKGGLIANPYANNDKFNEKFNEWRYEHYIKPEQEREKERKGSFYKRFRSIFKTPKQNPSKTNEELQTEFLESPDGQETLREINLEIFKTLPKDKKDVIQEEIQKEKDNLENFQREPEKTIFLNNAEEKAELTWPNILFMPSYPKSLKNELNQQPISEKEAKEAKRFVELYRTKLNEENKKIKISSNNTRFSLTPAELHELFITVNTSFIGDKTNEILTKKISERIIASKEKYIKSQADKEYNKEKERKEIDIKKKEYELNNLIKENTHDEEEEEIYRRYAPNLLGPTHALEPNYSLEPTHSLEPTGGKKRRKRTRKQ
jgi:hypothetical protein